MRHSFEPEVAADVGINAAVIFQNIVYWCEKNAANEKHIHDGKVWTYNSLRAFEKLFPYLTINQIRTALDKLESAGYIGVGNFNETAYDRTRWFCVLSPIHLGKIANRFESEPEPIPVSKPDTKPDRDLFGSEEPQACSSQKESTTQFFDDFWSLYPRKLERKAARAKFDAAVKSGVDPAKIIEGARRYVQWLKSAKPGEFRPEPKHPTTWLNKGCWDDELPGAPAPTPNVPAEVLAKIRYHDKLGEYEISDGLRRKHGIRGAV